MSRAPPPDGRRLLCSTLFLISSPPAACFTGFSGISSNGVSFLHMAWENCGLTGVIIFSQIHSSVSTQVITANHSEDTPESCSDNEEPVLQDESDSSSSLSSEEMLIMAEKRQRRNAEIRQQEDVSPEDDTTTEDEAPPSPFPPKRNPRRGCTSVRKQRSPPGKQGGQTLSYLHLLSAKSLCKGLCTTLVNASILNSLWSLWKITWTRIKWCDFKIWNDFFQQESFRI